MNFDEIIKWFSHIWKFQIIEIQGVKLAFGNIFLCLVILVIANRLSRLLTRWITKKIMASPDIDRTNISVYEKLIHYTSLFGTVLFAFTLSGIPMTVFTVLGGALAIGVGFGSQNIVNNFISGIIILIERPLKVGDVVEIDGIIGTVELIGTRSTRLRTIEHKHYIVPNSSFLEKNLLNWSLNNAIVRNEISVGVAYGSDTQKVKDICLNILTKNELIMKKPAPMVIFNDFGESALEFKLFFWLDMDVVDTMMAFRSDIRFQIDHEFRENNIEIPFPQRDLHLKNVAPIEVQIKH